MRLCFEVTLDGGKKLVVVSRVVHNKAPHSNLKLITLLPRYGAVDEEEDMILLCSKICEDTKVIFFFESDGKEWEKEGILDKDSFHHGFALKFKAPKFKDLYIQKEVTVSKTIRYLGWQRFVQYKYIYHGNKYIYYSFSQNKYVYFCN